MALFMLAFGALFAMPLTGVLIGRHGSRTVTRVAASLFGAALATLALAGSFASLCAAFFAYGVASGALDVAMNAQGVTVEERHRRPIMSSFHGMFSLGAMAGALVAGPIAGAAIGLWPHLLAIGAIVLALGSVACHWMLPIALDATTQGPTFVRPSRDLLVFGFIAFCALLGEGAIGDWSAVYLRGHLLADAEIAAAAFAAFSLMMAIGRFTGDALVARLGDAAVLRGGGLIASLGLAGTLLAGRTDVAIVGFGLVGAGLSCVFPIVLTAAARSSEQAAGVAIAGVCTLGYFGFLAGPPVIGFLAELSGLPVALGLVVAACAVIVILGGRAQRHRLAVHPVDSAT